MNTNRTVVAAVAILAVSGLAVVLAGQTQEET